jgi:RNA polymerase sigma factor for flagellar operon FliA
MAVAFDMSAEDYFALERNATHGRSTSLDELTDIGAFLADGRRERRGRSVANRTI